MASFIMLAAICAVLVTTLTEDKPAYSKNQDFSQPVNTSVGTAKGIHPGRVVWIHNPDATNENCTNSYGDGWFLNKNNNQDTIDHMVSSAIQLLTGEPTDFDAWNALFKFFNQNHGYGSVGYSKGEKILVKINATSGWAGNYNTTDLTKVNNNYYAVAETSPQMVLSVLRQLVNVAGVDQADIYVGDPMKHIYKHCYEIWHSEFPGVNYLDHDNYSNLGRVQATKSSTPLIFYSDKGSVLSVQSDQLYQIFQEVRYTINLPALKAHARAGITLFAKNHFGSHCRDNANHLHNGLVDPNQTGNIRSLNGSYYGLYRVQVDLMGHKLLGGKELFFLLDGLWAGSEAIDPPTRWKSPPFNSDWSSSVFASQDPVAIESVAFDFLRTEYTATYHPGLTYPQMDGVDDYLHQAADNASWPAGITYDPENDGTPLGSLGVHEHWNNETDRQYSGNLGTGEGIELITDKSHTQEIELTAGWNIISMNVTPKNRNMMNIFQQLIQDNYLKKVMDEAGLALEDLGPFGGWQNGIGDWESTEGYKVNVNTTTSLRVTGVPVTLPHDIPLETGWNIMSWPATNEQNGLTVFQLLITSNILKKVMNEAGKTIEDWGPYGGWQNGIGNLVPGEGYKISVTTPCTLTISNNASKSSSTRNQPASLYYYKPVFVGNGTDHMNINLTGLPTTLLEPGDEIGIFDDETCVGAAALTPDNFMAGRLSIPAGAADKNGEKGFIEGNPFSLGIWKKKKNCENRINPEMIMGHSVFVKNGSAFIRLPKLAAGFENEKRRDVREVKCYPNPFSNEVTIETSLEHSTKATIDVFNLSGQLVRKIISGKNLYQGTHLFKWNGRKENGETVPPGIYFIRVNAGSYSSDFKIEICK